jgi:hypothetical protein
MTSNASSSYLSSGCQTANVIPTSAWTHSELTAFAKEYPSYCYDIVANGIVPASLFEGIPLPVPESSRQPEPHPGWSPVWAFLKDSW